MFMKTNITKGACTNNLETILNNVKREMKRKERMAVGQMGKREYFCGVSAIRAKGSYG